MALDKRPLHILEVCSGSGSRTRRKLPRLMGAARVRTLLGRVPSDLELLHLGGPHFPEFTGAAPVKYLEGV